MSYKPRISLLYVIIVIIVFYYTYKKVGNNLQQLILTFALIDFFIAMFGIVKGMVKREMAAIIAGAVCGLIAYSATKHIAYTSLFLQVMGGIVGTGTFIRKSIGNVLK
jgi:hypothetical protein